MQKRELAVRGAGVDELPEILFEQLKAERKGSVERYDGNGFDVLVAERYYLRNNSDQQATVIFEREDDESSLVTIVSGGGGAGLLQISLGSHSKHVRKIENRIAEICDGTDLSLEAA